MAITIPEVKFDPPEVDLHIVGVAVAARLPAYRNTGVKITLIVRVVHFP